MEDISNRQQAVLEVIDTQIKQIDRRLEKLGVSQLVAERQQLLKAKAALLNIRGMGRGTLSIEVVQKAFKELGKDALTVFEIAEFVKLPDNTVRSHLNRHRDEAYRRKGDKWELIGEEVSDE